ncbi:MAG TPA: PPOX class F420-dependent oxidoreductase [Actinomycetota bacterium]|jgi:PPOX class probable F420-dependent enzyme|nr:PPOX class F420-dependent oxidoreductase [Actinomycetota bacterium]
MGATLTEAQRGFFRRTNFGHLATLMPDGSPHVSPVWVDVDGDHILVNTAAGRLKERNVRRDPRVAISVRDQDLVDEEVTVRGRVVDIVEEGAAKHIDALAQKYRGRDYDGWAPGMRRLILRIEPDHVTGG